MDTITAKSEKEVRPDVFDREIERTWEAIDALISAMWETGKFRNLKESGDQ